MAPRSTLPVTKWPKPATQSSSAAWKRSVPTIFAAVSGKAIIITSPKNVPEPTEVRPTMNPPKIPIRTAIVLSRRCIRNGALFPHGRRNALMKKPIPPITSAIPSTCCAALS